MEMQLVLIDDTDREWRIDDETRAIGRRGIEAARLLLRTIPRRSDDALPHDAHEPADVRHAA